MTISSGTLNISDSRRDAEKYHKLLLAIESATKNINRLEQEGRANIDEVLASLLPDLTEALDAAQAFVAVYHPGKKKRGKGFEVVAIHPQMELKESLLPWSKHLGDVLSDGKARVVEPFEDDPRKLIHGLEVFGAKTAVLVRMQIGNESRILGICNRARPEMGPFLAADRRAVDSIVELIAIGMRVGGQRRQELENIQNISTAINAELNPEELLPLIAQKAADVFSAPAVSVMLWDKTGKHLSIKASHGLSAEYVRRQRISKSKVHSVIAENENARTFTTPDLQRDPFGKVDLIKAERLHSALRAQLRVSGEMIGILNIYSREALRAFNAYELELAEIFANHAAIAIHNADLRQRELEGLLATSDALKATFDESELLQLIAVKVNGVFDAPVCLIVWDETKKNLVIKACHGLSDDYTGQKLTGRDKILTGDKEKKDLEPFVMADWRLASNSLQDLCKKEQFFNALVAPLVSSGATEVMGFLLIFGKTRPRAFTSEEMKIAGMIADQATIAIRTTQLHGQNKQRGEQLNALDQIALDITGELEIKELLQSIVQRATELVRARGGIVYSYDEKKKEIVPVAAYGDPGFGNTKMDKERGIIKEIIRTKAPLAIANYYRWSKRQFSLDPYRLTAVLGVPILSDRHLLGIIAVHDDKEDRSFGKADEELLQRFANHAAVAIENANTYAAEHEAKDYLDRLVSSSLDTIAAITKARDLTEGLNALAEGMVKSLGVAFCHILFLEPDGHSLRVKAAHPVARPHSEPFRWRPEKGKILDLEIASPMRQLLQSPEPVVYRQEETEAGVTVTQHIQKAAGLEVDLQSALLIPLKGKNGALGICTLGEVRKWERSPFTEERIKLARSIADQSAGLIDRLQTYEALRLREGLLKTGKEITSLQDLPKVLQTIAEGVRDALNCDLVTLYIYNEAKDKIDLPTIAGRLDHPDAPYKLGYVSKKSIVWKILESGESHFADDAPHDPWMTLAEVDRHPGVEPFVLRERISSSAGIPLIMGKERMGILFASYRSSHPFSENERRDMQLFATQAAIAINNARLAEKEEKKRKHLEAVINSSKVITASVGLSRQQILERILEQAVETIRVGEEVKATLGTIQQFDEKNRELVFERVYPQEMLSELKVEIGNRLPVDSERSEPGKSGITVRAANTRKPQLVPNVENDPNYIVYSDKTKSELAIPLIDGDRLIGVLDVENDSVDAFDDDDVEALQALADMAVVALKNAERAGQLSFANTVASMGAWGAEIAHDVNRETGAIQRKLYLLQQYSTDLSPGVRKILGEIESYAQSLVLPPLPKRAPQPGEIIETKNAVNLDAAISSYIEGIKTTYPEVVLTYDLHCEKLRAAMHERWLHGLLRHLVSNAIRSTEGKELRRVLARTTVQGNFVKVEIEDSGKGIRPEFLPRLFKEPIHREDDDRDGQGLLIVRFLAERHGGSIGISWSKPGKGACFYFTIPIMKSDIAQT